MGNEMQSNKIKSKKENDKNELQSEIERMVWGIMHNHSPWRIPLKRGSK